MNIEKYSHQKSHKNTKYTINHHNTNQQQNKQNFYHTINHPPTNTLLPHQKPTHLFTNHQHHPSTHLTTSTTTNPPYLQELDIRDNTHAVIGNKRVGGKHPDGIKGDRLVVNGDPKRGNKKSLGAKVAKRTCLVRQVLFATLHLHATCVFVCDEWCYY